MLLDVSFHRVGIFCFDADDVHLLSGRSDGPVETTRYVFNNTSHNTDIMRSVISTSYAHTFECISIASLIQHYGMSFFVLMLVDDDVIRFTTRMRRDIVVVDLPNENSQYSSVDFAQQ